MQHSQRRLILIGIFALVTITASIALYEFMKGQNLFRTEHRYYVQFNYVDGLYISNRVLLNGMRIGLVSSIEFAADNSGKLVVELTVPAKHKLQKQTTAQIINTGLIGGRMVRLNHAIGPGPYLGDGDTLQGETDPSYAEMMETDMRPIIANADTLLRNLKDLTSTLSHALTPKTSELVHGSVEYLHSSLQMLHSSLAEMPELVQQVRRVVARADSGLQTIDETMRSVSLLADTLRQVPILQLTHRLDSSAMALNQILMNVQEGQGTIGKLVLQDSLYNQLQQATMQLDSLAQDIRTNPKRYVHFSLF